MLSPSQLERERAERLGHLREPDSSAERALALELDAHPELAPFGRRALDFARGIEYEHPGQSKAMYLAHPMRVTSLYLRFVDSPAWQGVVTSLIHNVLEVGDVDEASVRGAFGEEVALALRTLTVDRTRQWDASYKSGYYDDIAASPPWVGQVKVLDKLDNLYLICLNPDDEVRRRYLDEIEKWIVPMAVDLVPGATESIQHLLKDSRQIGHRPLESWPESKV